MSKVSRSELVLAVGVTFLWLFAVMAAPAKANGGGHDAWEARTFAAAEPQPAKPDKRAKRARGEAPASGELVGVVRQAAQRHGIPPRWYLAKVQIESRFNCRARSHAGALGIGQVMPRTARGMGYSPASMLNCHTGADAGARYAKMALDKAGGNLMHASTLYLHGVHAKKRSSAYGRMVLAAMANYAD